MIADKNSTKAAAATVHSNEKKLKRNPPKLRFNYKKLTEAQNPEIIFFSYVYKYFMIIENAQLVKPM